MDLLLGPVAAVVLLVTLGDKMIGQEATLLPQANCDRPAINDAGDLANIDARFRHEAEHISSLGAEVNLGVPLMRDAGDLTGWLRSGGGGSPSRRRCTGGGTRQGRGRVFFTSSICVAYGAYVHTREEVTTCMQTDREPCPDAVP
jgi:hypothetical protein